MSKLGVFSLGITQGAILASLIYLGVLNQVMMVSPAFLWVMVSGIALFSGFITMT